MNHLCSALFSIGFFLLTSISQPVLSFVASPADPTPSSTTPPYKIIEDQAKVPIQTLDLSKRQILKIKLADGLQAYLVSDPNTDKSGALISVNAGSWEDPVEYPGIAHFLEHMLFLGTKKYPEESGYSRFISENGGTTNAYTSNMFTNYMFEVENKAFPEALDRFANFFKEPLFNPSGVSRELQAIDQEYAKNLEHDGWRVAFISKELGNPEHPMQRFNIGNSSTLSKVSRETLEKWYKEHYSGNLMRLVAISSLPIDQLRDLVVESFSNIPNSNRNSYTIDKPALSEDLQGKMVYVEPVKNTRTLSIMWELPPQIAQMKDSQPTSLVCHVLGHEGEESLLSQLKRENLAEALECGKYKMGVNNIEFSLEITLTDEGIKNINTVIERSFQAIANLKEKGYPRYLFDEVQRMASINYQYQPREDLFDNLMKQAEWISDEDLATYPEQTLIVQKYDPNAIKLLVDSLTPQRAHFYFVAPKELTQVVPDQREKWLGAEYSIKPIAPELIEKWSQVEIHPQITLPSPNPFIPQSLTLVKEVPASTKEWKLPVPEAIINNSIGLVYFAPDTYFHSPKVSMRYEIKTPNIDMGSPASVVIADLYAKSVANTLSRFSYAASIAGLKYEVKRANFGLSINVEGYSDHVDLLLEEILKKLSALSITEDEFKIYKESLLREYQNFAKKSPLEQAIETFRTVLYKRYATERCKALAISKLTFEKFNSAISTLFDQNYLEGMIYGNITREDAMAVSQKVLNTFKGQAYPKNKQKKREIINFPDETPYYLETKSKMQGNALILAIQNSEFSFKSWAMQQILMQAMKEPFFTDLRTKQQTGYIVYSDSLEVEKHLFNLFAVQSNSHATRDLLARFELFLESFLQEISDEAPEERFDLIKTSLINELMQPPKDISETGVLLQHLAFERDGDFEWIEKRINGFKQLTYAEFLKQANELIGRTNKRRVAIMFNGIIPEDRIFNYAPLKSIAGLRKISDYECSEE